MGRTIAAAISLGFPFLVCEEMGSIVGYVYGRPFRPRPGYRQTIETAVYLKNGRAGNGLGSRLYEALFDEITGFHSAIATIALPNDASVRLHEKFGFERAGHIREAGFKFGRWFDVGYWQRMLE
jgi:phosphinothricin acetyltransferase